MRAEMTDQIVKNIDKPLSRWSDSEAEVAQLVMINATKSILCDFKKKLATSKNKKQDIEQLITGLEKIVKRSSSS
jgi:hypothetical protein